MRNFVNVVLVDDDEDDRQLFKQTLNDIYPEVLFNEFESGPALLSYLKTEHLLLPELIFMDINMPEMNGLQLLKAIKAMHNLRHIPIIMYSTGAMPEQIERARRKGAIGYAQKPNSIDKLEEIIIQSFAKFLHVEELPRELVVM